LEQLGKYQLIKKLAVGGMAEVFLARAEGPMGFSKTVVVKRILPHLAEDTSFSQMFLSEARIAAELNHPNIVQIFDFGEDNGTWFIAMEFIDGANLREMVRRGAKNGSGLPYGLAARIISQACEGLGFAHDHVDPQTGQPLHLIHRDISPDNIMVSRNGAVKVVDFGVAKAALRDRGETRAGVVKGKLAYMAPEQLANEALDRRADVYSLGIVLFELLSGGEPPFNDQSEAMIVQAILSPEPLYPISRFRRDVPMMLERIIAKAVDKEPSRRYPNCKAFQADLERFIVSLGEPLPGQALADLVRKYSGTPSPPEPALAPVLAPVLVEDEEDSRATALVHPVVPRPPPLKVTPPSRSLPMEYDASETDPMAETQLDPRIAARRGGPPVPEKDKKSNLGIRDDMDDDGDDDSDNGHGIDDSHDSHDSHGSHGSHGSDERDVSDDSDGLDEIDTSGPTLAFHRRAAPSGGRAVVFGALAAALLVAGAALWVLRSLSEADEGADLAPPTKAPSLPERRMQPPAPAPAPNPGLETAPPREVAPEDSDAGTDASPGSMQEASGSSMSPGIKPVPLDIRVVPYARVYLDGMLVGETPFAPVNTSPGKHSVRLVNMRLGKDLTLEVMVKDGEENILKYNLKEE